MMRVPGVRVTPPETNIIFVELEDPALDVAAALRELKRQGVLMSQYGPRRLRAITHLDVDDTGIARAAQAFEHSLTAALDAPRRAC
jgi:threonine aldolase